MSIAEKEEWRHTVIITNMDIQIDFREAHLTTFIAEHGAEEVAVFDTDILCGKMESHVVGFEIVCVL